MNFIISRLLNRYAVFISLVCLFQRSGVFKHRVAYLRGELSLNRLIFVDQFLLPCVKGQLGIKLGFDFFISSS